MSSINPGDIVVHWINRREIQCVEYDEAAGGVRYKYVDGFPPGDGHRMLADRWRWLATGKAKPAGKKHRPGVKVRQR